MSEQRRRGGVNGETEQDVSELPEQVVNGEHEQDVNGQQTEQVLNGQPEQDVSELPEQPVNGKVVSEQPEQPVSKQRKQTSPGVFMGLGLIFGAAIGTRTGHLSLGMGLGLLFGVAMMMVVKKRNEAAANKDKEQE